jgi:hypothetical protein
VYKTWTLKNTSDQTADDLHVVVTNKAGTVVEAVSKARSAAFTDPPSGEGTSTLDWPGGAAPAGSVPPGLSDQIAICNEDADFLIDLNNAHFTHGGNPLATKMVALKQGWDLDDDATTVSLDMTNFTGHGAVLISSIQVYKDNNVVDFRLEESSSPYHVPSGTLVFSDNNIVLNEGDPPIIIDLGVVDLEGYELMVATIAPMDDPSDVYFVASGFRPGRSAIPTVSEWGLIVMALLLLTGGTIILGRRKRPATVRAVEDCVL